MTQYFVTWTIDIEADTAEDAAVIAHEMQLDPLSIATVFTVATKSDIRTVVDTGTSPPTVIRDERHLTNKPT